MQTEHIDNIEALRLILETQQRRPVTNEEASEVAESLIAFFKLLGEDVSTEVDQPVSVSIADGVG